MKDWTKIASYDKLYQAELIRDLLNEYDIKTVLLNEKDSAFLLGEIDLYVEQKNAEKAKVYIGEFAGWVRIDTFVWLKQIEQLNEKLKQNQFETMVIKRMGSTATFSEYELYVKREQKDAAQELLQNLEGWIKIAGFDKVVQAAIRVKILENNKINSLVINKRDSDYNLVEISLLVEKGNAEKALPLINNFRDWEIVDTFKTVDKADLNEALLEKNYIEVVEEQIKKEDGSVSEVIIKVKKEKVKEAKNIIDENKSWIKLKQYASHYEALLHKDLLEENEINSVLINSRDSAFLLGEILLFIEKENGEKASILIKEFDANKNKSEIEE